MCHSCNVKFKTVLRPPIPFDSLPTIVFYKIIMDLPHELKESGNVREN